MMVRVGCAAEDWRSLPSYSCWKAKYISSNWFSVIVIVLSTKCAKLPQIRIKGSSTFLTFKILEYMSSLFFKEIYQAYHTIPWSMSCGDHCKCQHIPSYHRVIGMGLLSSTNIFIFIFIPKLTFKYICIHCEIQ